MIRIDNLRDLLGYIGYKKSANKKEEVWSIDFPHINSSISVDFSAKHIIYPFGLKAYRETTTNFSSPENFVVLECITRLLSLGYTPQQIELEKPMPGGHSDTGGYCDILIKDNNGNEFLLIECKTADDGSSKEFSKAWHRMNEDGGQLFNYFNSYRKAKALCLYASDCTTINVGEIVSTLYIYNYLKSKQNDIFSLARGAAQPHVYPDDVKDFPIPLPPFEVQQQIVDECAKVDAEYETSRMAIEDYRQRISKIFTDLEVIIDSETGW